MERTPERGGKSDPCFFLSFFFLMAGGVVELSGGSPQRPPSLPMLANKRGFFSEEHSDVGGGCECGPCVRAAAAAAAPFVCFPSPTLVSANHQNYTLLTF